MSKGRILRELWNFLWQEKKFWLLPIVTILMLFGLLLLFTESSAIGPFLYTLF